MSFKVKTFIHNINISKPKSNYIEAAKPGTKKDQIQFSKSLNFMIEDD